MVLDMLRLLLLCLVIGTTSGVITTNCTGYDGTICSSDALLYCFTDGTSASGSCAANTRICDDGAVLSGNNDCLTTTTAQNDGTFLTGNLQALVVLTLAAWLYRLVRAV